MEVSIGLVGVRNSSFPVNLVHLWNGGPEEGWLAVQLKRDRGRKIGAFKERLREVLSKELPDVRLSSKTLEEISRQVADALATSVAAAEKLARLTSAMAAVDEAFRLARSRREFGIGVVAETILAEQEFTRVRLDLLNSVSRHNKAQYSLFRATVDLGSSYGHMAR